MYAVNGVAAQSGQIIDPVHKLDIGQLDILVQRGPEVLGRDVDCHGLGERRACKYGDTGDHMEDRRQIARSHFALPSNMRPREISRLRNGLFRTRKVRGVFFRCAFIQIR
jgi:hypothetical protein